MSVSLDSQIKAIERLTKLRPGEMVRAGIASRMSEAELLTEHLKAAVATFQFVASDERIRRYLEQNLKTP